MNGDGAPVIGCPACGYNLVGLPPRGRCPECGKRYRDLKPGRVSAFWTHRGVAMLLVGAPSIGAAGTLLIMALIDRGIGVSQPGIFGMTFWPGILTGLCVVWGWQIPLLLLSGAAALLDRFRFKMIAAYMMGAATHLAMCFWGAWVVYQSHDAQAPIGILFVPFWSGLAGWAVACVSLGVLLLIGVIRRA